MTLWLVHERNKRALEPSSTSSAVFRFRRLSTPIILAQYSSFNHTVRREEQKKLMIKKTSPIPHPQRGMPEHQLFLCCDQNTFHWHCDTNSFQYWKWNGCWNNFSFRFFFYELLLYYFVLVLLLFCPSVSFSSFAISSKSLEGRQETDRQKRERQDKSWRNTVPKAVSCYESNTRSERRQGSSV